MSMTTSQVESLAQFMDAVQTIAVENGINFPANQTFQVAVSDGEGSENLAVLETREKRDSAECDYDWWLELGGIY